MRNDTLRVSMGMLRSVSRLAVPSPTPEVVPPLSLPDDPRLPSDARSARSGRKRSRRASPVSPARISHSLDAIQEDNPTADDASPPRESMLPEPAAVSNTGATTGVQQTTEGPHDDESRPNSPRS